VTGGTPWLRFAPLKVPVHQMAAGPRHRDPRPPLVGSCSRSVFSRTRPVAPHGFSAPSSPSRGLTCVRKPPSDPSIRPAGPRGLPDRASRDAAEAATAVTLSELHPLQGMTTRDRHAAKCASGAPRSSLRGASSGVSSPTTRPTCGVYAASPGLPHPVRSVSRVSHPPDGFLLHMPSRLVSSR
jgi:hypothetical protein